MNEPYTRREILTGVGVLGVTSAGAWLNREREPAYTQYTYAQTPGDTHDQRLVVGWHETYNGTVVEHQRGVTDANTTTVLDPTASPKYVEEANGPVIQLGDVVPGDRGQCTVGVLATDLPDDDQGIDVWMRLVMRANRERGINEPESKSPGEDDPYGTTDGTGELAEALSVTVWEDTGTVADVGRCDGILGVGETSIADASLVEADDQLADGRRIAECLQQGSRRCIGLTWEIDDSVRNPIQSDSVAFDLVFYGQSCGQPNPWG